MVVGGSAGINLRSLRAYHRSSSELTKWIIVSLGVCRKSAEALSKVHWKFAGSSPEEAIDAPEQVVVNVLRNIVVSM